jgi:hypothetical protein
MPGTPATSPRFGAARYSTADPATIAAYLNAMVDTFDSKAALWLAPGTFAARPAANAVPAEALYFATDRLTLYRNRAQTAWDPLTVEDGAVTASKLAANSVGNAAIQDGSITPGELAILPAARISRAASQAPITNGTLVFGLEEFDTDNMSSIAGGGVTDRLTFNTAGIYVVEAGLKFNLLTELKMILRMNGITEVAFTTFGQGQASDPRASITAIVSAVVGNYVQLVVQHGGDSFNTVHLAAAFLSRAS